MHILGVDVGATKTEAALLDPKGTILSSLKMLSKDVFEKNPSPSIALADHIVSFCQQIEIKIPDLLGVGIGVPGDMDQASKRIGTCPNLPVLDGVFLGPELSQLLGTSVVVENDVNLICLGEFKAGRGKGINHLACVYVGTGIGCGFILDGNLYIGADGAAGELGHTILVPGGRQCNCGQKGCLEMYCSGKALAFWAATVLQSYTEEPGLKLDGQGTQWTDAELLINAAKAGNTAAIDELNSAFYYLGIGISNLVSILNPRLIILGGGISEGWPDGINIVKSVAKQHARGIAKDRLIIDKPVLGGKAGLVGAAFLLQEQLKSQIIST